MPLGEHQIAEIVSCIREELEELTALRAQRPLSDLEFGQLLAYAEALSIIQSAVAGYDLAPLGLDFDVDSRYLI